MLSLACLHPSAAAPKGPPLTLNTGALAAEAVSECFAASPAGAQRAAAPLVEEPGSPVLADRRGHAAFRVSQRSLVLDSDAHLHAGSKRACQADEEDNTSRGSGGSSSHAAATPRRTVTLKRMCSAASSDSLHSLHLSSGDAAGAVGSSSSSGRTPAPRARSKSSRDLRPQSGQVAKPRGSSRGGSSSVSASMSHSQAAAQASCCGGQEAASAAAKPKGPRLRLGGRLLSPEEAQAHLQAAAAAASKALAASQQRGLALLPSAPGAPGSFSSLPAGVGTGAAASAALPCGGCVPAAPPASGCPAGLALPDVLPDDWVPTPNQAPWQTLASTLDDEPCGSPMACGDADDGLDLLHDGPAAGCTAAALPGGTPFAMAAAAGSSEPWQLAAPVPVPVPCGGRASLALPGHVAFTSPFALSPALSGVGGLPPASGLQVASSCPGAVGCSGAFAQAAEGVQASSLSRSLRGATGSPGLEARGGAMRALPGSSATDAELVHLLGEWAPQQQQQQPRLVASASTGCLPLQRPKPQLPLGRAGSAAPGLAWRPAFAAPAADPSPALSSAMVPTPGLPASLPSPGKPWPPQQPQHKPAASTRAAAAAAPSRKGSRQAPAARAPPSPPQAASAALVGSAAQRQQLQQQLPVTQQQLLDMVDDMMQQHSAHSMHSVQAGFAPGAYSVLHAAQAAAPPSPAAPALAPSAALGAADAGAGAFAAAAAAAALAAASSAPLSGGGAGGSEHAPSPRQLQLVDDILPSMQDLLTECW